MSGIYTNAEMADQIIIKLDGAMKALIGGERLGFCAAYVEIMQMLASLKRGIEADAKAHRQQIKLLEDQLACANAFIPTEDGGKIIGGETFELNLGAHGEIDPKDAGPHEITIDTEDLLSGGKADE